MIARAMAWSARHHRLVLLAAALLAVAGELGRRASARDVLPELADPQILLVAEWMGHPATEVEGAVARPVQAALATVPKVAAIRGSSMSGMASIAVVFSSRAALADGQRAIAAILPDLQTRLPAGVRIRSSPESASTGWVFQYALIDPSHGETQLSLRRFQDEVLRPALAAIPGVAEIASVGGELQQVLVDVRSNDLRARRLAFGDVLEALDLALAEGRVREISALERLPLRGPEAGSPLLGDVARVSFSREMPSGLADSAGLLPAIGGIVVARPSVNLDRLIASVRQVLEEQRARIGGGVQIQTVYDRSELAARVDRTLRRALLEEIVAVALVVLIFLFHAGSVLVPLITLPLVLLATFAAMWLLGIPLNVMSVGGIGIALGLAVDADVVALEACHRRLERASGSGLPERRAELLSAVVAVQPAILTALLITALSFLPVLAVGGETGRLLRPLALTKTLVIGAAALIAVTLAPALRDRLLRGSIRPEFENPLTRALVRFYGPFVRFGLSRPVFTLCAAALALASAVPIAARLGGEFLPRIEEGDLLFMPTSAPGAPHDDAVAQLRLQDRALADAPEVETVFGKVGRADSATDPAPMTMAETLVRLRPREEWPGRPRVRWHSGWAKGLLGRALGVLWPEQGPATTADLVRRLDTATRLPGWTNAWTAPARARLDMTATGARTPLTARIVGGDPARLDEAGAALRNVLLRVPGTRSAVSESLGGESFLRFVPDEAALVAHGVSARTVKRASDALLRGAALGEVEALGRKLRVRVVRDQNGRGAADQLRDATVRTRDGSGPPIALGHLGRVGAATAPAALRTEGAEVSAALDLDLTDGTDLAGYVDRARAAVDESLRSGALHLAPGQRIEWGGQYALLAAGARRISAIAALVAAAMCALLYLQFRSVAESLLVLASVPFALVGSIWTLFLLGYPMSAPVWVGLLSVAGLAMQTGVVTVVYIDAAFHRRVAAGRLKDREDIVAAHAEGTIQRLRPKVMTVTTMAAGLLPLLWAEGPGAEIMRRVAAPMIGGLVTSAFLTLEVLPVLYTLWRHHQLQRARRLGVAIETVIGPAPSWARR